MNDLKMLPMTFKQVVLSTQEVRNLIKFALSVTVFKIDNLFPFPTNFKMGAEIRKILYVSEAIRA